MGLEKYRQKRDFAITPEPAGEVRTGRSKHLSYVIQKHAATRLHYDFRLELNGVLLSWAVPKGPSLDPNDKRLAMHVEDHPMEYGDFEGVIPAKQYGAGTVMVWDRGTWIPKSDPNEGYAKGRLKFDLDGEKLKGGWNLVKSKSGKYRSDKTGPNTAVPRAQHDTSEKKCEMTRIGAPWDQQGQAESYADSGDRNRIPQ